MHFRTCSLCEAMCGLAIESRRRERFGAIRGDEEDPFSRGHICPKAVALGDLHDDPDRLRRPLRRDGTGGRRSAGTRRSTRSPARLVARPAARTAATRSRSTSATRRSTTTARCCRRRSCIARCAAAAATRPPRWTSSPTCWPRSPCSATSSCIPVPDVDRTQYFLMLGANPLASNGSLMTAPGIERRLRALKARGGRLVVVDPRRTETAALADGHLLIRPGTDALLLLALLHTLLAEGLARPGRLARLHRRARGRARRSRAHSRPSASRRRRASPPPTSVRLAREFARRAAAVCYGRVGVSTQEFGGARLLAGERRQRGDRQPRPRGRGDVRAPGGGPRGPGHAPRAARAVRDPPHPRARAAGVRRRMAGGGAGRGDGDARARGRSAPLLTVAGNPVLSTPNGGAPGAGPARPRLHGRGRLLPERDHAPRAPHPAAGEPARARPLRPRVPPPGRAQHREVLAAAVRAAGGGAARLGDPPRPVVADRGRAGRPVAGHPRPARRPRAGSASAACST